jgi:hypothetical protein
LERIIFYSEDFMTPIRFLWAVLAVVLLTPFAALAQNVDTSIWEVAVYQEYGDAGLVAGSVSILSREGISETYPVPSAFYEGPGSVQRVILSPDYRYLVGFKADYSGNTSSEPYVLIADLVEQTCCTYPDDPAIQQAMEIMDYQLGDFSPDGQQFALMFVDDRSTESTYQVIGDILTIDLETGQATAQILTSAFDNAPAAFLGKWDESGIRVAPSCYACEPPLDGDYWIWNPQTGQVSQSNEFWSWFGDRLPLTGEFALTTNNPDYPMSNEADYLPPANVIEYFPSGMAVDPAPVVYFNPDDLDLPIARWVLDGAALWVWEADAATGLLVYRDGSTQTVNVPAGFAFLAATPDGWLMFDEQNAIYHFLGGQTPSEPLVELTLGTPQVVRATELGASGVGTFAGNFQAINALPTPIAVSTPVLATCPGFMTSRLTVGQAGRVTPGDPNNIRSQPSTTSAKVGEIPGGQSFTVLAGPQCGENMAWWQVDYNGVVGWTTEGQGSTYWLEPAS